MISKNLLILAGMLILGMLTIAIFVNLKTDIFSTPVIEEEKIFPEIIGDMLLKENQTGKIFVRNIVLYDDFRGDIVQGYRAKYSGSNRTMIIFLVQVRDNITAKKSLKDMVVRAGFNESRYNESEIPRLDKNTTVVKLPVRNPEVFAVQKSWNQTLHYIFSKKDKVYWVGFSDDRDIEYQFGMLVEVFRNVDKKKGDFGLI